MFHRGLGLPSAPTQTLQVAGVVPLSTVDWPSRLAAVVFLRGCPWRCGYCHNPHLQGRAGESLAWSQVLAFLEQRRGWLDGLVFSGGEPTGQAALLPAVQQVRALGLGTALHTGGAFPERLAALLALGLLDWVGLDLKAAPEDYTRVTGVSGSGPAAWRSLALLLAANVPLEVRVTVWPAVLDGPALIRLAQALGAAGGRSLVLQACRDRQRQLLPGEEGRLRALAEPLRRWLKDVEVRL